MTTYLDHAATTPMLPAASAAMLEQMGIPGNASSLHTSGRAARRVVEESRERIAKAIGARPSEVIFTSGGTESDNLAIKGTYRARRTADPTRTRLVVSGLEHHAVLDAVEHLVEAEGAEVTWVEPDACGIIPVDGVREAIDRDPSSVALVSVMWANNEVGTVQDIAAIAEVAHAHDIPVHTDAVQAVGHLPVDFTASGVDLLTLTGHKLGGPVGVGALVARRDAQLVPLTHGGGQERRVRSGTLDVPAIRALAVAIEDSVATLEAEAVRLVGLRDRLIKGALAMDYGIRVTGCWDEGDVTRRLPGNAHLLIPGCEGDSLLYLLDAEGIECSTGSACQAGVPRPSHVVLAMGIDEVDARGALRISFGRTSADADVDHFLEVLPAAVERARRAAGGAR
ncbi:cysteine desulfurase family protein [Janibacter sp. G1551]|uniref:cysteine desulfurase family protein n=1 Tax=Janibacter sp. G1551 TaxID=3420440 RepID=UPI003D03021B